MSPCVKPAGDAVLATLSYVMHFEGFTACSVAHISSIAAHFGSIWHVHYAVAKGVVLSSSRSLARELAPRTRVNAVSPGIIDTAMVKYLMEQHGRSLLAQTPMKRMGRPEEIAKVISFLRSDSAGFITDETIHVNGGLYIAS